MNLKGSFWLKALTIIFVAVGGVLSATAQEKDWRVAVNDLAKKSFNHPAWGYAHAVRDYKIAKELAAEDKAAVDDDVLYAAAMLHDMAAFAPWESKTEDHADKAARVVQEVLDGTGFPMSKIDKVRDAIRTHMYYRNPATVEAKYIHDADALDWLGAIGAARILSLADSSGKEPTLPATVKLLEKNLAEVPQRVLTPAGQKRVPALKAELADFIANLRRQTDNLSDLQ